MSGSEVEDGAPVAPRGESSTPSEPLPTVEEVQGIFRGMRLREALQQIADFPIREDRSAGWHFAEVRHIARTALEDDDRRESA